MASVIPGMEGINWFGIFGSLVYWLKIGFYSLILIGLMGVVYILVTYNIKATIFPIYGSGKDGVFSVSKKKWNRYKWIRNRSAWKPLLPILTIKEVEPIALEYIYPGNRVIGFEFNGELIPGRINIDKSERTFRAEINPVPHYVRNWQSLTHKKHAMEYAEKNWWQENKAVMISLMAGIAILIAACVTVYLTYKFAGGGREDIHALTNAIKNFGNIPGKPPM